MVFKANEVNEIDEVDEIDEDKIEKNKNIVYVRDYIGKNLYQHSNLKQDLEIHYSSTKNVSRLRRSTITTTIDTMVTMYK